MTPMTGPAQSPSGARSGKLTRLVERAPRDNEAGSSTEFVKVLDRHWYLETVF
jgi:hypothetical protein